MATLTYAQLEQVWLQAAQGTKYNTQAWAALMAAIAEAESSGRTDATNPTDNGGAQTSWGLWQISLGNHNAPSPQWADPVTNAKLAIGKLNSQGLGAWGTYTSGAYRSHLQGNVPPGTGSLPGGGSAGPGGISTTSAPGGGVIGGILQGVLPGGLGSIFGGILGGAGVPQTDTGSIASDIYTFIKMIAWLYNPANWVRIAAFVLGLVLLSGSAWMFKESM